jgi:cell division septum initiation protein DivIVA
MVNNFTLELEKKKKEEAEMADKKVKDLEKENEDLKKQVKELEEKVKAQDVMGSQSTSVSDPAKPKPVGEDKAAQIS